jgi:hypothetical protein
MGPASSPLVKQFPYLIVASSFIPLDRGEP